MKLVQPGTGIVFTVPDARADFWTSKGYVPVPTRKAPARSSKSKKSTNDKK